MRTWTDAKGQPMLGPMTDDTAATLAMTTGGDARILLDPGTGLNRYFAAPRPSGVLAYASSTANDISAEAFAHLDRVLGELAPGGPPAAGAHPALQSRRPRRLRAAHAH